MFAALCLLALRLGRLRSTPLRDWHWLLLLAGGLMLPWYVLGSLTGALLLLGWRSARPKLESATAFNLQVAIIGACGTAVVLLAVSAMVDLQGRPDFLIAGNGSSASVLRWTEDRTTGLMPRPWVLSVPLWGWRAVMVAWLAWAALKLVGWGQWGFRVLTEGGPWRQGAPADPAEPTVGPHT